MLQAQSFLILPVTQCASQSADCKRPVLKMSAGSGSPLGAEHAHTEDETRRSTGALEV